MKAIFGYRKWGTVTGLRAVIALILSALIGLGGAFSICLAKDTKGANGSWSFAVIGDHRGDNSPGTSNSKLVLDPATGLYIGFKDKGIATATVAQLAQALKGEGVEFVLEIGDLATKHIKEINGRTPDQLLTEELALWAKIWNENSCNLPIYPVRGNQEYTASEETWLNFTKGMPGIGALPLNGPEGEQGLTYAFHYKNCLFVGVDHYVHPLANGDTHLLTPAAQAWVAQVLAESDRPFKFVYGHAPAYEVWNTKQTNYYAVKDGLANPYTFFSKDTIAHRDAFWTSVAMAGAEYFCGHEHIYARGVNWVDGRMVRQTIIGNGGAPYSPTYKPTDYPLGPFGETYVGINLQSKANTNAPPYVLTAPLIVSETTPRGGADAGGVPEYGYVVVTVHGSHVTGTYKSLDGSYEESWTIVGTPD